MKRRQESIIYQLAVSDRPLTTDELAKRLSVSSRTIKYEMTEVRERLRGIGAELIAKRNEGYSLHVIDSESFKRYLEPIGLQSSLANNFGSDDNARFLYIARKLVSSSRFSRLEDIANELFLSRSAIREAVNHAMNFLKSYHLETESKPGLGIRAFGTEYHMRMAMTELFAVHFHKVLLDNAGMDYAKWTTCDYEERQDIRHVFLKILRESEIKISDVNTQRLAIYFIIVRNRCLAGYRLKLPPEWKGEIKDSKEFGVASSIYKNLREQFEGFDLPEEETIFLGIYLMACRDMWNVDQPEVEYRAYYKEATIIYDELCDYIRDACNLELMGQPFAKIEFLNILISLLIHIRFGLESIDRFWYDYENQAFKSPVSCAITSIASEFLKVRLKVSLSTSFYSKIASFVFKMASLTEYEIKGQKLLMVNSNGLGLNEIIIKRILGRYKPLIASFTIVELYEIRGLNQAEYDVVLTDTSELAYHYDLPCCVIHTLSSEKEMDLLFNRSLVKAFQIDSYVLPERQIEINRNYHYTDELQFLQFLSFRHGQTTKEREELFAYLKRTGSYDPGQYPAKLAVVYLPYKLCKEECMELYCLNVPGTWRGKEIEFILLLSIDWKNDWRRVKAMENSLRQLFSDYKSMKAFSEKGRPILLEMIETCIKSE